MKRNMEITRGLYASQSALLMLTEKGLDRKEAYEAVQRAAMKTWKEGGSFADNLAAEPTVAKYLTEKDIAGMPAQPSDTFAMSKTSFGRWGFWVIEQTPGRNIDSAETIVLRLRQDYFVAVSCLMTVVR